MRRSIRERPRFKERPVDPRRPTFSTRPGARIPRSEAPRPLRRRAGRRDAAGLGHESPGVWPSEGVKAAAARRGSRGGLHGPPADAGDGAGGRGRAWVTTTQAVPDAGRLSDLVARDVTATRPNQRSLSDFTYVATWRGVVSVAFVIDVFARRIVGRRASASLRTDLARDALEQAVYDRCAADPGDRVHHSDRGTQGEFNRSLQQLCKEKLQWVLRNDVDLIARGAAPSVHQVVRRRDVVTIGKSSGRPSRAVRRAGMQHSKPASRNRLERGGSARRAACHRPT